MPTTIAAINAALALRRESQRLPEVERQDLCELAAAS